ncbi:SAM-dependent methyltransferase [Colwellia sp. UCD-KL20]|uniref:SAM-dependent methyltransferase n=1 Tax=Colwellia sp. UCD-KL20 TaxID=1917165 RepID=UPI0009708B63|nr:SAM-dependent methyltransferase [Colwellia sp. UCD-KL20]
MTKNLYIIGYGINIDTQISIRSQEYIDKSDLVFALEVNSAHLSKFVSPKKVINLFDLYKQGVDRSEVYNKVSDKILDSFCNSESICLMVEGSPYFLDSIVEIIESKCALHNIDIHITQGSSSLESIIYQLRIPIETVTLSTTTAENFCNTSSAIGENSVVILFQPANALSNIVNINCDYKEGIELLLNKIKSKFNSTDKWMLVNLGNSDDNSTQIIWNTVDKLEQFSDYFHSGTLVLSNNWVPKFIDINEPTKIEV